MMRIALRRQVVALAVMMAAAGPAWAQVDLFSRGTLSGVVDLRLVAADGETAFTDGGFGKARYGGGGSDLRARIGEATVAWNPRFSERIDAVATGGYQGEADHHGGLSEAYVRYRPPPGARLPISGRAGLYYPNVSLEHDGLDWTVADTLTPSAINSWVAEEVKVAGAEITAKGVVARQDLSLTLGAFQGDDTAGTLLSFRGWALHDLRSTASGVFQLPPLSAYMAPRQRDVTTSVLEIDDRTGVYASLVWRKSPSARFTLFIYDNNGDLESVTPRVEWAWDTRFAQIAADLAFGEHTRLKAQAMTGNTAMGFPTADGLWVDVDFASAYVLVMHDIGKGWASGRVEWFETTDLSTTVVDNNDEEGWAMTGAYTLPLSPQTSLVFEALRVDSERLSRALASVAPKQAQTILQLAARTRF